MLIFLPICWLTSCFWGLFLFIYSVCVCDVYFAVVFKLWMLAFWQSFSFCRLAGCSLSCPFKEFLLQVGSLPMVKLVFLLKNGRQKPACHRREGTHFRARRQVNSHRSQMVFFSVSKSITNVRTTAESFSYSKKQALNPWFSTLIAQEDHLGSLKNYP